MEYIFHNEFQVKTLMISTLLECMSGSQSSIILIIYKHGWNRFLTVIVTKADLKVSDSCSRSTYYSCVNICFIMLRLPIPPEERGPGIQQVTIKWRKIHWGLVSINSCIDTTGAYIGSGLGGLASFYPWQGCWVNIICPWLFMVANSEAQSNFQPIKHRSSLAEL